MCEALRELMKDEIDAEIAREVAKASEKARTEAIQQGRAEGRAEGRMEGENRLNQLYVMLENDGRMKDISRAMKEPEFLHALYREYGIAQKNGRCNINDYNMRRTAGYGLQKK